MLQSYLPVIVFVGLGAIVGGTFTSAAASTSAAAPRT